MGHGWSTYFLASMVSGDSLSAALDLGRGYPTVYVEIASTPSQSEHQFRAAATLTGTYNTIYHPAINSSTVANNIYKVGSGVTGAAVPVPGGFRYMKVYATAAMTNGNVYKVFVSDE
jgi:hypothetical protein